MRAASLHWVERRATSLAAFRCVPLWIDLLELLPYDSSVTLAHAFGCTGSRKNNHRSLRFAQDDGIRESKQKNNSNCVIQNETRFPYPR